VTQIYKWASFRVQRYLKAWLGYQISIIEKIDRLR
jgi:hypothetical protein